MDNQYLSIKEAAEVLGVSSKTLRRWGKKGILKPERTSGGHRRYKLDKLTHFKANRRGKKRYRTAVSTDHIPHNNSTIHNTKQTKKTSTKSKFKYSKPAPINTKKETVTKKLFKDLQTKEAQILYQSLHATQKKFLKTAGFFATLAILFLGSLGITGVRNGLLGGIKSFNTFFSPSLLSESIQEKETGGQVLADISSLLNQVLGINIDTEFRENILVEGDANFNGIVSVGSQDLAAIDLTQGDLFIENQLEVGQDITLGADTISDFTGDGLQVVDGALSTILGDTIDSTEIVDGSIIALDLSTTNDASDNQILSYDAATGTFTWVADEVGESSTSLWTDGGAITFLTSITDDLALGGSSSTAPFFMDVSTGILNLTGDLSIDSIQLSGVGTDEVTSGASLIGVFDEFTNSSSTNLQDVLDDFDAAMGAGSSKWSQDTGFIYLANTTDSVTIGGTSELGKLGIDGDADQIQLLVQGNGTQTSDLVVFEQSDGTDIFTLTNSGNLDLLGQLTTGSSNIALTVAAGYLDADAIQLISSDGAGGTSSGSGLEVDTDRLGLLQGCADGQVLKWTDGTSLWECANDSGATSAIINVENNDIAVGTDVDTLDFSTDFLLAASPSSEVNISIADDILNFTEFSDSLVVDASTTVDLYNGASDVDLQFFNSDSGDEILFLDGSTGNVGVGLTNPSVAFEAVGTTAADETATYGFYLFSNSSADESTKVLRLGLRHRDTDEEPFYITSSFSNVSTNTLGLGGGTAFGNAATVINFYTAANTTTTTGTARMTIDSTGRVGIGDTTPDSTFDVDGGVNFDLAAGSQFVIDADTADTTVDALSLDVGTLTNGVDGINLNFDVTGDTGNDADSFSALNITASNNALDQTTDDDVYGIRINDLVGVAKDGEEFAIAVGAGWDAMLASTNGTVIINGSGEVVGSQITDDSLNFTEFSDSLVVDANTTVNLYNGSGDVDLQFFNSDSSDELLFLDGSNGFVGIGDATPSFKLDVTGTGRFTGDVIFGEQISLGNSSIDNNRYINSDISLSTSTLTYGIYNALTNSTAGTVVGTNNQVGTTATTGSTFLYAGRNIAIPAGASNLSTTFGAENRTRHTSTGNITSIAYGSYNAVGNESSGTIADARAVRAIVSKEGSGSITTGAAVRSLITNVNASGTIGTAYGFKLDDLSNSGTITTLYGLHLGDLTAGTQTNVYGIWADTGDWILDDDGNGTAGGTGGGDLILGEDQDFEIYFDGSNAQLLTNTGDIIFSAAGNNVIVADGDILDIYGGIIGLNTDSNANDQIRTTSGTTATASLYWGDDLLCDPSLTNCGWATSASSPWQTTAGVVNLVTAGDTVTIGSATSLAKLAVDGDADEIQLLIQGNGTQTSNLVTYEQSDGNDVGTINNFGDYLAGFTDLSTSSLANGAGSGTSTLVVDDASSFDIGNYVQITSTDCQGTVDVCYAKIRNKSGNTLTLGGTFSWADNSNIAEYHIPEIGGSNTADTLINRFGQGYFISGVVTGNGSTFYEDQLIRTSDTTSANSQNLTIRTGNTTTSGNSGDITIDVGTAAGTAGILNIGNTNASAITLGSAGMTTTIAGNLIINSQELADLTGTGLSNTANTLHFDCSEVEGTDIDCSGESITLESTIDSVSTINLAGTGTLNGLDAVDATGENTIEALIFDSDAESISGVWTVADSVNFRIGTGGDLTFAHDATNSTITSATGDLIVDNTLATGSSIFRLGTDTSATDFQVQNNSEGALLTILGSGDATLSSTLSVQGNTIGLNNDADANNIIAFGAGAAAAGSASDDLYWGDVLLCDADASNCGWATSGGSSKWSVNTTPTPDVTYLTETTFDLAVGGTDGESPLFFDVSASALNLNPFGTSTGNTGEVRFQELEANGDNYTGFKSPDSLAGDVVYTLPSADAAGADYTLVSNAAGILSWKEIAGVGGVGDISAVGNITSGAAFTTDTHGTSLYFADNATLFDANDNELLILDTVASAVNEITLANAATGGNPAITLSGDDTDIGFNINLKGTDPFTLSSTTANTDSIAIKPQTSTATNSFTGTITSADLTAARAWTLKDASGTLAFLTDIPTSDNYQHWVLSDGSTTTNITSTSTAAFTGGTGITTTNSSGTVDFDFDSTEIGTTTWGSGSSFTWTFDAGTTDPTIAFGDGSITLSTATVSGLTDLNGNLQIADTDIAFDGASTTFTTTGAFTLTPGGAVLIGDGGDTGQINTSDWDISTTGGLSGISGIGNDGAYTQTGASSNAFTGDTTFSKVNAAGGSEDAVVLSGTLGAFDGTDTFRGLYLNYTNADHTGSGNNFYGIDIANITGDAEATETGINIGTGWDTGIAINSGGLQLADSTPSVTTNKLYNSGGTLTWNGSAVTTGTFDNYQHWTLSDGTTSTNITSTATATVTGGTGITADEASGTVTFSFDCSEVEGTDIDCSTEAITLETTLDSVDTINLAGTGTLNGLDAVDATGENTIEALIFDSDAESITGVWTVADGVNFRIGTGGDLTFAHDATNSTITSATGDLIVDNTLATGSSIFRLGTDTTATDFQVQNNSEEALLSVLGDGTIGIGVSPSGAYLDIAATTTALAQVNLTSSAGTNVASPTSGDLWWNGTNLYFYDGVTNQDLLSGGGSFNSFIVSGDGGDDQTITDGNTLEFTGGTGILTTGVDTDVLSIAFDSTEIGTTTWGSGSGFTWTFDAGATDPTIAFASDQMTFTAASSIFSGDITVQGGTVNGASGESIDLGVAAADTLTFNTGGATELTLSGTNLNPGIAEGNSLGSTTNEWEALYLGDDNGIFFGLDQNFSFGYDELTDNRLELTSTNEDFYIGLGTGKVNILGTSEQLRLSYDASNYLSFTVDSAGNLTFADSGNNIATFGQAQASFAVPAAFNAAGDVSIAYDIVLTNQTASTIESYGPLTIRSGESFENNNLTLKTYGTGNVVMDLSTTASAVLPGQDDLHDLGSSSFRWDDVYATNGTIQTSDERLKQNVENLNYGLNEILALRPVSFEWRNRTDRGTKLGLIAQEVLPVLPEVVDVGEDKDGLMGIRYDNFVPILINAIKEQQNLITQMETQLALMSETLALTGVNSQKTQEVLGINNENLTEEDLAATESTYTDIVVLDTATLHDVNIDGTLQVGLTTLGFDGSISTIGDLKLQSEYGAGNVNIFSGKVVMTPEGNIEIDGELSADSVKTNTLKLTEEKETTGQSTLPQNQTSITIQSDAVKDSSRVFVTPRTITGLPLIVTDISAGEFTVEVSYKPSKDIEFDWLVVEISE